MTKMIEKQVIIEKEDVVSHYQSWTDAKKSQTDANALP